MVRNRLRPGSIVSHILWVMSQSGVESVVMTVASFLVVRWFGPQLWGQMGILLAGVQLITMMSDGFSSGIIRFVSQGRGDEPESNSMVGWQLAWFTSAIMCAVSIALGMGAWALSGFSSNFSLIILAIFLATFRTSRAALDSALRGLRTFDISAVAGIICAVLMAGSIIYFTASGYRIAAYLGVMVLFTAANCVWLGIAFKVRFGNVSEAFSISRALCREFIVFSFPLVMRGLSGFLAMKVNIWFIGWLATDADAGQFRLADQFLTIPALLFSAILSAIAPRIAKAQLDGNESFTDLFARMNGLMLVVAIPVAVCFLFNGYVINFLFPGFEMASKMLVAYAPSILIMGLCYSSSIVVVQGGKPKAAFWLSFLPSVANVFFVFVGFYMGGVMGLVIGSAILQFATFIAWIVVTHKLFKVPFKLKFK